MKKPKKKLKGHFTLQETELHYFVGTNIQRLQG